MCLQAFAELQVKLAESRKGVRQCEVQREMLRGEMRKTELTRSELSALAADAVSYQTLGRMFVKQTVAESLAGTESALSSAGESLASVEKKKEYLEKSMKEAEANLREMVAARQANR